MRGRLKRLSRNTGPRGTIQLALVSLLLVWLLKSEGARSTLHLSIPLAAACLYGSYLLRDFLVNGLPLTGRVMNAYIVILCIASAFFGKAFSAAGGGYHVAGVGLISIYLGCFFWLMSDSRVGRTDK